MLYGSGGRIECRSEGGDTLIRGTFPYRARTELAPGRYEVMEPGALHIREDAYLLAGHDFAKPLASRTAGSLTLTNNAEALTFEARISQDVADTSHGRDALALIRSGLAVGLSPGFRVSPDGESVRSTDGGILRTIRSAELFELSIVTRPAYSTAQVEARSWQAEDEPLIWFLDDPATPWTRWR